MKIISLITLMYVVFFISCSEIDESTQPNDKLLGTVECKIINEQWNSTNTAYAEKRNNGNTIVISSSNDYSHLSFIIDSFAVSKNIYKREFPDSIYEFYGEYSPISSRQGYATSVQDTGTIIIQSFTNESISGKFYFLVSNYGAYAKTINEGSFSVKFIN